MATTVPRGRQTADAPEAHSVSSEPMFGRQIRFAIRTLRKQPSSGDDRLFGNQIRFACRTLRAAIRQERADFVPDTGNQPRREAAPASQGERETVPSGLAHRTY
jgi:hypothetical protein